MPSSTSIIFVVDPPVLVLDSILLLASIRKHMPDIHVAPYCPVEKRESLPKQLIEYFNANNAPIQFMKTQDMFSPLYKQGNKLLAALSPRPTDFTLFLDTDIMVIKPFDPEQIFRAETISAAPEGRFTWGKTPRMWPSAYATFGMDVPSERIKLAKTGALSPPYFNAGVVGFPNKTQDGQSFAEIWMDTAQQIDADPEVTGCRPWLDQISLPVAMKRAGFGFNLLEKQWNLSLTHKRLDQGSNDYKKRVFQKAIDDLNDADPYIIHYHIHSAMRDLQYNGLSDALIAEFTCFSSFQELQKKMRGDMMTKSDLMSKYHTMKKIKNKTEEEATKFKELDALKRRMQSGNYAAELYQQWPESILPNT